MVTAQAQFAIFSRASEPEEWAELPRSAAGQNASFGDVRCWRNAAVRRRGSDRCPGQKRVANYSPLMRSRGCGAKLVDAH
jgi:hypothetical protein